MNKFYFYLSTLKLNQLNWYFQNKDASPVVCAMEDALTRRYPKSRYFVASPFDKALAYFYQFFPTFVYDFITLKTYDKFKPHIANYKKQKMYNLQ